MNLEEKLQQIAMNARAETSVQDFYHLRKIEWAGFGCLALGLCFAFNGPNLVAAFGISLFLLSRWGLAHHILHGAYDNIEGIPKRYTSKVFARSWRRWVDWPDWMPIRGWCMEHNHLHHHHTGEIQDPDIPEEKAEILRKLPLPNVLKYLVVLVTACTWKWSFYSASTVNAMSRGDTPMGLTNFWDLRLKTVRRVWSQSWLPYVGFHFVCIPSLFLFFGQAVALSFLINRLLAEVITNFHTFFIIVTNHSGEDIYRFSSNTQSLSFTHKQILGSVNFSYGNDVVDFFHMFLNYQIEHHLFPNLTMLQYQKIAPAVREVVRQEGLPYVQENLLKRSVKLLQNLSGEKSMLLHTAG